MKKNLDQSCEDNNGKMKNWEPKFDEHTKYAGSTMVCNWLNERRDKGLIEHHWLWAELDIEIEYHETGTIVAK